MNQHGASEQSGTYRRRSRAPSCPEAAPARGRDSGVQAPGGCPTQGRQLAEDTPEGRVHGACPPALPFERGAHQKQEKLHSRVCPKGGDQDGMAETARGRLPWPGAPGQHFYTSRLTALFY